MSKLSIQSIVRNRFSDISRLKTLRDLDVSYQTMRYVNERSLADRKDDTTASQNNPWPASADFNLGEWKAARLTNCSAHHLIIGKGPWCIPAMSNIEVINLTKCKSVQLLTLYVIYVNGGNKLSYVEYAYTHWQVQLLLEHRIPILQ